jgi:hypothetical protein
MEGLMMKNLPQRRRASRISKLKFNLFLCALAFFHFSANAAEIYRWIDDAGVVHITDDRSNIPNKYWEEERVKKEEIKPSQNDTQPVAPEPAQRYKEGGAEEIFGDHSLEWWIDTFREIRQNIADIKVSLDREKNFVTIFGGGRGYGKVYSKEEIAQYERSKADILVMEEDLKNLNKELEELQRKARIYGVPKKVTE